ncbi:MAG: endo-1,4-beta-xylanase [Bacteroidales bacterium]
MKSIFISASAAIIFLASCKAQQNQSLKEQEKGLKDYYSGFFPIGVAVAPNHLNPGVSERELILKEFNSLTAENVMKMRPIHPEENRYFWENADIIVNFAAANNLKVRGHTLCWYQQTPSWIFKNSDSSTVTKEVLLNRLKDHIIQVVTRYKGKVYAWDVVNEAIDDNPDKIYRESQWYRICGEEYIEKAFIWAHEADPEAVLFYNDYNTENPSKRDKIYNMLKDLLEKGIPVHGIGLQGHWSITNPSEKELREAIEKYSSLGIKVQVTEFDVSVYDWNEDFTTRKPGDDAFTSEREQKQIEQYKMLFRVLRDYKDIITGVTFWNVSDKSSWLDNFPVRNRKNYPLLFDRNLQRKKAYYEVTNF